LSVFISGELREGSQFTIRVVAPSSTYRAKSNMF